MIRRLSSEQHAKTKRPNKHTDRVAWNDHFERDLFFKYDSFSYNTPLLEDIPQVASAWEHSSLARLLQDNAMRTKEIIQVEENVISLAIKYMVHGSFEAAWMRQSLERKQEIALEGLYRGACNAARDNSRVNCPEMTIEGLIGDGEYNLINLVSRSNKIERSSSNKLLTS